MKTVVHEMRNLLAVLVANVEAFCDGKLQPTPGRLKSMLQVLHELDELIDDIKQFDGTTASVGVAPALGCDSIAPLDVCELVANEVLALEAVARRKGLTYSVSRCARTHEACRTFLGDRVRIAEVVQNLLLNAIRFTPRGGTVNVDCRCACGELVFTVIDDGPGVTPGEIDAIFAPGYRGTGAAGTQGSGVGLTLVKRFVEEHGGKIDVRSGPSAGATFIVSLPGVAKNAPDPFSPSVLPWGDT